MKRCLLVVFIVYITFSGCNPRTDTQQLHEVSSAPIQESSTVTMDNQPSSSKDSSVPDDETPSEFSISSSPSETLESQKSTSPSSVSTPIIIEPDNSNVYIELSRNTIQLSEINASFQIPYKIYNYSSMEIHSSPEYSFEKYDGSQWVSLDYSLGIPNWPSVVYSVPANGSFDETLCYLDFLEAVTPGKYRLLKYAGKEGAQWLTLYAEFTITE